MKQHNFLQGTPEWHAHRATARNASDAPAVLGCSKYQTRQELLHARHTGLRPEASRDLQRRFDDGHAIEAAQLLGAQDLIGDDLYPVVGTAVVDGIELSASFDGLTMAEDTAYECKTLNDELRACLAAIGGIDANDGRNLPKMYRVQMEQQLAVSGAERVLFVAATKDGSDVRRCWYYPDHALRAEIIAGWKQFDADLAAYVPPEIKERPPAEVTLALPALVIHAKGEITTSNMQEYGEALKKRLAEVRAIQLITDQDFSNAKESAKLLRENIQQAKLAKEQMLAQTVTVGEAARMIDTWCEDMRVTALKLEQDVEREDKAKKAAMIAAARSAYEAHIEALKRDTGGPWIMLTAPNWPEAIKSKRSFASMQDALDTMLANAKIAADESARKIRAALACMDEEGKGYEFLLSDRLAHIGKPVEDVRTLVRARITEHKAAEERRAAELAERERARIRAEEQERADREAREREAAARQAREQIEAAQRRAEQSTMTHPNGAPMFGEQIKDNGDHLMLDASGKRSIFCDVDEGEAPTVNVVPRPTRAPAAPAAPTLMLREINARIAPLSIDASGLASLGFPHAGTDRAAKLYHEHDFAGICLALVKRLQSAAQKHEAAA